MVKSLFRRIKWMNVWLQMLFILVLTTQTDLVESSDAFSTGKAGFSVKFKDEVLPYRVLGVYLLRNEIVTLEAVDSGKKGKFEVKASAGTVTVVSAKKWRWKAPVETGLYDVRITDLNALDSIILNVFVMIPYVQLKGEYLNGYRIGKYPTIPLKQLSIYKPPKGFIEVTPENEKTLVSPHFTLKQFLCKQEGGNPKYVVLKELLLLKLELILEKVNENGYRCDTFDILSGYRTPYYNYAIGNVKYSRHIYGGAADIFIDEDPQDDMMDDLNRDGRNDYHDAVILYDIIDQMYGESWYESFLGGLGRYKENSNHGPFVHVDTRGFRARWGD